MNAKDYVSQIKKLDTLIKNKNIEKHIEKQKYYDIALSTGAAIENERVQTSPTGDKVTNAVNNAVDIERKFDAIIKEYEEKRQSIIDDIEKLPEAEYDVLHLIYVQHLNFDEAAEERKISRRTVASIHGNALIALERVSNCTELQEFA